MKILRRLCFLSLFGILSLIVSSHQASGQGLADLGVNLDLPSDWELVSSTTDRLPEFGMYVVQSEAGGAMWMSVHPDSEENRLLNKMPIRSNDVERTFLDIENAAAIPGYLDGYIIQTNGYDEYIFKSLHNDLVYDFRIGFWHKKANEIGISTKESGQTLTEILASLKFID